MGEPGQSDVGLHDLGPIGDLAEHLRDGSVELSAAREIARKNGLRREATPEQLVGISRAAIQLAFSGKPGYGIALAEVCYEAARGAWETDEDDLAFTEAWAMTTAELVEALHIRLNECGDIRLYKRAAEVALPAMAVCERVGLASLRGLLALRFGTLLLDAYTAGRTPVNYEAQFDAWVARAQQTNDPELRFLVARPIAGQAGGTTTHESRPEWPKPLEALDQAEGYLRCALGLVVTELRGRTLKALAQALEWRGLLGGGKDETELRAIAERALRELEPDDTQARLAVLGMLQRLGTVPTGEDLVRSLEADWDSYVARVGQHAAWDAAGQAVANLQDGEPQRALALLQRRRGLANPWADEFLRSKHFEFELILFAKAYRASQIDAEAVADIDRASRRAATLAQKAESPVSAREAAASLVAVMLRSTAVDREGLGLALVDALMSLDASLWSDLQPALSFLVAGLLRGEGVNRMRAGVVDEAATYYLRAADAYGKLRMGVPMVQCIEYLDDVVDAGTGRLNELTAWLVVGGLNLELAAPSSAPAALQRLGTDVLGAQITEGTSVEVVQMLFQVLKGRRFAAMLAGGIDRQALYQSTSTLLARVADAETALAPDSDVFRPTPFDAGLGDDDLLTAWVDEYEKGPSETPADRLANLQRAVERHLAVVLAPARSPSILLMDEIRERLDSRTALVQLFEGRWPDGTLAVWQLLIAREFERVAIGRSHTAYGTVHASWRGRSVTMPLAGLYVGELRRAVQWESDPLDVAPEASERLASGSYLRVVEDCREELHRSGIDRLIVVPHGASHYLPLHLFGEPDQPLGGQWIITYLANVGQLRRPKPAPKRDGVGVFALSYADQPQLPRLDDSVDEAHAIAKVCGASALVDDAATERAFIEALKSRRFVHVRAHGRLYVDAPSFHTVFLHPADGHDGRLRAHEVLSLDLGGLELVTLGACETALGRVDQSDNPRGLPAALLLAGAQAVVGTLWPVLASASTLFFTELYRYLINDDDDVREAFAVAQRTTRQQFPQYRDWGCFYLIGGVS